MGKRSFDWLGCIGLPLAVYAVVLVGAALAAVAVPTWFALYRETMPGAKGLAAVALGAGVMPLALMPAAAILARRAALRRRLDDPWDFVMLVTVGSLPCILVSGACAFAALWAYPDAHGFWKIVGTSVHAGGQVGVLLGAFEAARRRWQPGSEDRSALNDL